MWHHLYPNSVFLYGNSKVFHFHCLYCQIAYSPPGNRKWSFKNACVWQSPEINKIDHHVISSCPGFSAFWTLFFIEMGLFPSRSPIKDKAFMAHYNCIPNGWCFYFKGYEDWLRHKADREVNNRPAKVIRQGQVEDIPSKNVKVSTSRSADQRAILMTTNDYFVMG